MASDNNKDLLSDSLYMLKSGIDARDGSLDLHRPRHPPLSFVL